MLKKSVFQLKIGERSEQTNQKSHNKLSYVDLIFFKIFDSSSEKL